MKDHAPEPPARPAPASGGGDGEAHRHQAVAGPARSPFGAALRRSRRAAGLSQEVLAERAGLSARTLSDLERGVATQPRLETVRLLATALALPAAERAALLAAARPAPPVPQETSAGLSAPLTPLIGRGHELALLTHFLAGDVEPPTPLLLLAGEPGVGKTRLLQATAQQAIGRGWTVLEGGCYRRGGQAPYAPLLDALARHLHLQRPALLEAELEGCAWLGRLLPELAPALEPLPTGTLAPEQERRLVYAAVARFLANVAGPAGTLLVLDDLQWAGPDALDLLAALLRGPARPGGPAGGRALRMVGAYRDSEVQPTDPLGLLRADLARAGLVRHHALGPLAPAEAAELLAGLLGEGADEAAGAPVTRARVLARAGGTPFYLVSYAQALRAAGVDAGTDAVPWDVAQGVRQRVALLPDAARELLGVAAIVGRRAPWALLLTGSGQREDAVLAGLEAACQARLLLETEDGVYAFAHDVIREVVEGDLGVARRAVLHRRVAEALEAGPADAAGASAELLAYHYRRAGVPDKAAAYLELAGDAAWAQRAQAAAERHYTEAIDHLDRAGHTPDAPRVREKLGEVLFQTGRYAPAIAVLEVAADAYHAADDEESLRRVMARIGWDYARRGRAREGLARLQPVLDRLDHGGASPASAALYAALAQLHFTVGQYAEALGACERVVAMAAGAGERPRMLAMGLRMITLQHLGRLGEALQASQEALPLAEAVGDLDGVLRAHRDLAHIYEVRGDLAASQQHFERALTVAAQVDDAGQRALTLAFCGWIACVGGEMARARSAGDEAVALSRQVDRSWYSAYPLILRARLALVEGAWDNARTLVGEALALTDERENRRAVRWAAGVLAELDILEGRPEGASARLAPLIEGAHGQESDVLALLPLVAWAQVEQGQVAQATAALAQVLRRARRAELRLVLVDALRVQALVGLRQGQWMEAAQALEDGLTLARALPYPYAEARLLHLDGQRHLALGDGRRARTQWEAALAFFRRLGARKDVALAEQALTTLPGASPPAAATHRLPSLPSRRAGREAAPAGKPLTRPERQAWALDRLRTAGGLSPRAYARELRVSVDTALLDLRELVDRGLVRAEGATKDRRYLLAGATERAGDSPNERPDSPKASHRPRSFGDSP